MVNFSSATTNGVQADICNESALRAARNALTTTTNGVQADICNIVSVASITRHAT